MELRVLLFIAAQDAPKALFSQGKAQYFSDQAHADAFLPSICPEKTVDFTASGAYFYRPP